MEPTVERLSVGIKSDLRRLISIVGPSRCAADSTDQDYHQVVYNRPLNTIADPAPSPTAMPAQHQLHSF